MVEEAVKTARDEGCKEFGLYLLESTKHNQPFYEKYGFGVIGHEMRQSVQPFFRVFSSGVEFRKLNEPEVVV